MKKLWTVLTALAVGACATGGHTDAPAPVVAPLHSDFTQSYAKGSEYGPFLAATLAQESDEHARAAHYYMEALKADPTSRFVAERAFYQLLYAGRVGEAAKLAEGLIVGAADQQDDLLQLTYVLEAYKRGDWQAVRERLTNQPKFGFGFILKPLFTAWSYAAEGNEGAARTALKPLIADPRLKTIGEENLAYILDHLNQYDAAGKVYRTLIDGDKASSMQAMIAYAHMLYRSGQKDKARAFLSEKSKIYANSQLLLREAVNILSAEAPSLDTTTPDGAATAVFFRLAREFAHSRSPRAAIIYLRLAAYLAPGNAEISVMLGDLFQQTDDAHDAAAAYAAVSPSSSLRRLADIRRIEALEAAGHADKAEEEARRLLKEKPDDPARLTLLANVLRGRENYAEAAERYSQVVDLLGKPDANDWFIFFSRGVCYERLKDWQKAEGDMLAALKLNPGEASVLNYLGYSWIDRGVHIEEAKMLIAKAAKERPNDGFIIDSFGWVHYLTGDYPKAVELLEKAVRLEPDDPTINDHLGDAYWRVGRRLEARFQWRHALTGKPDEKDVQTIQHKLAYGLPDVP
ncbi:tetratricopeptide repeat protein [Kordiimonas marina]|uniref:tetratricopeptide repeat protein n=1 Tax=Kordiimonas marina TaxID=2872312 RepID=UPI001FF4FD0E|nr:tetratricopeptide repeat protein [Kordiimonas marina]MCJ9427573.1 tetratricopeptide repeat protein [Kordiimonas marina]